MKDISPEGMIRKGVRMAAILVIVLCAGAYLLARSMGRSQGQVRRYSMKRDLRALGAAQEQWYRDHGAYSSDAAALMVKPAPKISFTQVHGTAAWWRAEVRHAELPGISCVIWGGDMDVADRPASQAEGLIPAAGVPLCDGDR